MEKKDFERPVHTWMEKKGKEAIVYKMKEGERERDWKYSKVIALGHVRGYFLCLYGCITLSF